MGSGCFGLRVGVGKWSVAYWVVVYLNDLRADKVELLSAVRN